MALKEFDPLLIELYIYIYIFRIRLVAIEIFLIVGEFVYVLQKQMLKTRQREKNDYLLLNTIYCNILDIFTVDLNSNVWIEKLSSQFLYSL